MSIATSPRPSTRNGSASPDLAKLYAITGAGPVESPGSPGWTTPKIFQAWLIAVCVAVLLYFLAIAGGVTQYRFAMKTVGHDAPPSIVAAQHIKAGLAEMDADVANELLAKPGQNASTQQAYAQHRQEVSDSLETAAENVTYGDAERVPIRTILQGLGDYDAFVAQAGVFHKRGGDPEVLPAYHQASSMMHSTLFPAADALDKANSDMLTQIYAQQTAASSRASALVWVTGILLIAALAGLQLFLTRRVRRVVNPALLLATVLTIGLLFGTAAAFRAQGVHIKVAKEDSFDSVNALWHARATSYDANTAESRWLLDPGYATASANDFFTNIAKLASFGAGDSYDTICNQASSINAPAGQWASLVQPDFHGDLADELRNITFSGEKEAAIDAIRTLGVYVAVDAQIRQLQNSGRHADAIALCVGDAPGQSDWAFDRYDAALQRAIDINQKAFDLAVQRGDNCLNAFTWLTPAVCIAIAGLAAIGVLPRIREYHFS